MLTIGIDLGSTTVKYALLSESGVLLSHDYVRHGSAVKQTLEKVLRALALRTHDAPVHVLFSGSGALGLADTLGAGFVQEVIAASRYLKHRAPDLDAAIELGGEDAKLLYLSNGVELRMNEACAGGTGAFIDQMASLLDVDAAGLNKLASEAEISHPMASRCGVFAKTDLVALLNGGVPKSEVARSVLDAVAEQTVSGLACGRPVRGKIAFLGGPLTFLSELRAAFERRLSSTGTTFASFCDAHCAVAIGAALEGMDPASRAHRSRVWHSIDDLVREILSAAPENRGSGLPPLFKNPAEREAFTERHRRECVERSPIENAEGDLFLGADLGSTTVKGVVLDTQGRLLYSWYEQNEGQPLERLYRAVKALLCVVPAKAHIRQACTTGYGADLARAALGAAFSEVETLAHERAAAAFEPNVSYVIDIGGQDMKCLEVEHGLIRSVKLNEACSSGCGSFLQTFAKQLSLTLPQFVEAALASKEPCDLGTRCTVFMNSKVRQAQRDGASLEDIAAGLCRSIVRNALYKVLRIHDPAELGEHVVVQGGTFLNDAVLRAFEEQIGRPVIRPDIAGLMGAYGAALIAMERTSAAVPEIDLDPAKLDAGKVIQRELLCRGCGNHCRLTMNRFPSGDKFFSGNRCDFAQKSAGAGRRKKASFIDWKLERLFAGEPLPLEAAAMGVVGIPRALNTYEHYPYWFKLFSCLGFRVELSRPSDHALASSASETVPSQSLCFPAKLAHGHAADLARKGIADIWMPCVPLEGPRHSGEKHIDGRFACPVAGGYPEAMRLSLASTLPNARILTPFVDLEFPESVVRAVTSAWPALSPKKVRQAVDAAHAALVRESRSAELVQLMSFGCGIDAVTSEQIERLLAQRGRIATTLKIDEGDTLGAARIRLKSLLAALADRRRSDQKAAAESLEDMTKSTDTPVPLDKMLADRVIYAPQMAPIHFPVICAALGAVGWRVELLPEVRPQAIEEGLKHVNNDACYPAIVVIGQLLDALKTHAVDPDHSALLLAQTCGPCRATNYPTLLRWALKDLHLERVPVVCLSGGSIEGAQTLNVGLGGLRRLMLATLYGDMLQRLSLHVRSHELHPGDAQRLVDRWTARAAQAAAAGDARRFADDARAMVRDFFAVPMDGTEKIRVGIVGEILLKYHPAANLGIVQEIIDEGAEPVLGDLAAFFLYCLYDHINQAKVFGGPRLKAMGAWLMIRWFEHLRGIMRKALDGTPVAGVSTLAEDLERIDGLVSAGQEAGEGWLLTAEMVEFIHSGTPNVVCLQPFGCLPNHVTGKGVIRRLREENPLANICAIDFEAGTSKTNVSNRLKLFLAQARENFERGIAVDEPVPTAHRIIPITPSANIAVDASESPHKDRGGGQAAC